MSETVSKSLVPSVNIAKSFLNYNGVITIETSPAGAFMGCYITDANTATAICGGVQFNFYTQIRFQAMDGK